jgi:REP element-mobilizing transposase RayT
MQFRDYKIFRADEIYHIYNRGNHKEQIFFDEQDYLNYIKRLKLALGKENSSELKVRPFPKNAFSILCYCLMPNHFHLMIKQNSDIGINQLMSKVGTSYAMYFNKKYNKVGNVFQDAFKAKIIDNDAYITYLSAYIHNNPGNPQTYPYSNFLDLIGERNGTLCDKSLLSFFENNPETYKKFVFLYNSSSYQKIQHLTFEED